MGIELLSSTPRPIHGFGFFRLLQKDGMMSSYMVTIYYVEFHFSRPTSLGEHVIRTTYSNLRVTFVLFENEVDEIVKAGSFKHQYSGLLLCECHPPRSPALMKFCC